MYIYFNSERETVMVKLLKFYTASNLRDLFHNIHPKQFLYTHHWLY